MPCMKDCKSETSARHLKRGPRLLRSDWPSNRQLLLQEGQYYIWMFGEKYCAVYEMGLRRVVITNFTYSYRTRCRKEI